MAMDVFSAMPMPPFSEPSFLAIDSRKTMTLSTPTTTTRTNHRARRRVATTTTVVSLIAWMLNSNVTPADCFTRTSLSATTTATVADRTTRTTALHYRNSPTTDGVTSSFTHPNVVSSSSAPLPRSSPPAAAELPTWLAVPRSHLTEAYMERLRKAMRASFFTENETLKLMYAIEEAAGGDRNKIAGAAEFCLLLVETMEMGLNAAIASVFHYCSCVTAREHQDSVIREHPNVQSFGDHVVNIVRDAARLKQLENVAAAVTANQGLARATPDSHDAENLRKLLLSETKDWRALAIRSAACLYRLRGLLHDGPTELTPERVRVSREALYIYAPLASRLGMHRLKNELEGAAFKILFRRQYERVNGLTQRMVGSKTVGQRMQSVLEQVKSEMTTLLQQDAEFSSLVKNVSVTARVKEPYSMWKKMLRNGYKDISQVPDALALRIVLDAEPLMEDEPLEITRARERALCYYAQQLCTERWKPVEGNPRFKDYIERPKRNGYQSLHYTAQTTGQNKGTLEIQVRSGEMHQVAEYGLASHWDYKAETSSFKEEESDVEVTIDHDFDRSSEAYLRKVQQWHWQQAHGGAVAAESDATPASFEPVVLSDIWQSRVRADRIRARTQRLQPYIEALATAQSDLARDFVFVFLKQDDDTTDGKVLALPAGACILDALREGERTLGVPLTRGEEFDLNGAAASVTRRLSNGDVVTVPSARAATLHHAAAP